MVYSSGHNVYDDFFKYNNIEHKLGINKLTFIDSTNKTKEIINFLNTVPPEYTQGLNEIVFISHPLFSFSASYNGEELFSGEASGQYINETKDLVITANEDFKDTFYHEVGHYIYIYKFTDEDRKKWEELINISIDYDEFDKVKNEYSLESDKISSIITQLEAQREHMINEAFAISFSESILNESKLPNVEAIQEYFKEMRTEAENAR